MQIIEKLSVKAPSAESKLKVLKAIAQEYGLEWDSSNTEAELNKKYEDLLVTFAKLLFFLIIRTKWYFCMWQLKNQLFANCTSIAKAWKTKCSYAILWN